MIGESVMLKVKNMDLRKVDLFTSVNFSSTYDGLSTNRSLFFVTFIYVLLYLALFLFLLLLLLLF